MNFINKELDAKQEKKDKPYRLHLNSTFIYDELSSQVRHFV